MLVTLAASFLLAAGVLAWAPPFTATPLGGPTVFKAHITHGTFMAFAAFLFAERGRSSPSAGRRALWSAACALAAANVLLMTIGRTGYLVLFALSARRIEHGLERHLAQGLVVTVAASSLANSYLLDHAEGLFFAWLAGLAYATLGRGAPGAPR